MRTVVESVLRAADYRGDCDRLRVLITNFGAKI